MLPRGRRLVPMTPSGSVGLPVLSMALELADVVMMRKMLLNLRDRAESTAPMG